MSCTSLSWLEGLGFLSALRLPFFCLRVRFSRLLEELWDSILKEDLFFPDLQNTIIMHFTTCRVSCYCNYRILNYTYVQMCTALPKVFVNRIESDRLVEEENPQRRFLLLLRFFVLVCHSVSNPGLWKWMCM